MIKTKKRKETAPNLLAGRFAFIANPIFEIREEEKKKIIFLKGLVYSKQMRCLIS